MLDRIDRVQLAVPDRKAAAAGWTAILGAEPDGEDRVSALAARRTRLRLGDGAVELLEPDGEGAVAQALRACGAHLFAAGASSPDLDALLARLRSRGARFDVEAGQAFVAPVAGLPGLRLVLSRSERRPSVGAVDALYEVTHLVADAAGATSRCAEVFGLDARSFVPIESPHYGYRGTLTLFHPDRLDRFEIVHPHVATQTMGRFFAKRGPSLYMAFAESGELSAIEDRARDGGAGFTGVPAADERDGQGLQTLFLHPPALGGMMLGISRRRWAWTWSGRPERARP